MSRIPAVLAAAVWLLVPGHAPAQDTPVSRAVSGSVDLGLGLSIGRGGGLRHHRDGLAAAALLARRLRPRTAGHPVLGLGVSGQAPLGFSDDCVLTLSGGCAPDYPGLLAVAGLVGWEVAQGERGAAVRALAGPAAVFSSERGAGLGVQGRLDVATPALRRVALVAWAQGGVVPRLRDETYRTGMLGLGLRVR